MVCAASAAMLVTLMGVAAGTTPASAANTTPPVLQYFSMTPTSVDTSASDAYITVDAHITDDQGFSYGSFYFHSPSYGQYTSVYFDASNRTSGTSLDGWYETTMTVPEYAETGTWSLDDGYISDGVQYRYYYYSDFVNAGFDASFTNGPPSCNGLAATIVGTPGDDIIDGTAGNDVIVGLGGADTITGNGGADTICGGDGEDTIVPGVDSANDYVDGGTGTDLVPYGQSNAAINANLATGVVKGQGTDTLVNVENLNGSPYNDVIIGDGGPNQLRGRTGNDLVSGGGGDDVLAGEAGNDIVEGGDGYDSLDGGPNTDRCVQGAGSGSIVNCESTSPLGLSVNDVSAYEGSAGSPGSATFTVSLSAPAPAAVLVDYWTEDGSAIAGSDYQSKAGTVQFAIGSSTASVTVPLYGDSVNESDETFTLNLSNPYGAVVTDSSGQATIVNDDAPPLPSISISNASNKERQPNEVFTVTLSSPSASTVTVWYQTYDGTAHAGSDYKARAGQVTFLAGQTTKQIKPPLINDKVHESTEYFTVQLSNATNATIYDGYGVGYILDDD
jgi:hypothetical protein